jgi:hypothetical protein
MVQGKALSFCRPVWLTEFIGTVLGKTRGLKNCARVCASESVFFFGRERTTSVRVAVSETVRPAAAGRQLSQNNNNDDDKY